MLQPGETWINPNNTCELCECLDGMTRCTEKCQKPVCAAVSIHIRVDKCKFIPLYSEFAECIYIPAEI